MLLAAVMNVEASEDGTLRDDTGRAVHGLWYRHWQAVDPSTADRLHAGGRAMPFTLSPLMGLSRPQRGRVDVAAGSRAWLRVTALTRELSLQVEKKWLPGLASEVFLGGVHWRVTGYTTNTAEHPWAGRADQRALAEERLLAPSPPQHWSLEFATPTAFHGNSGHFPFPLPDVVVRSWLRRWQVFGPVTLPEDLPERVRQGLGVSGYRLKTVPVRDRRRVVIGCVGRMTMRSLGLTPGERAAVDLLAAYSTWCGTGHHTTQGMGMTTTVESARTE